ncbi:DUF4097 family beta strand repeat-containing protein [Kitasatospora azatica]|uniref:DUF4097 family beta strand repeat-containing protein n=1 Tax=Kitasatospora azatica TaxID=58347 RepID=UPI00055DB7D1|nr:DUF4097 family beta strand repeat-containing protein [Kitasatospora azatica]
MNQRRTGLLAKTVITAAVAFGMSGCFLDGDQHLDASYQIDQPVHTLVINGSTGDIRVVGGGTGVSVTEHQNYRGKAPATTHTTADGTLTLTYDCHDCGVDYQVQVPSDTVVKVAANTGTVRLVGLTAAVEASTDTGNVEGERLGTGRAQLRTRTGDLSVSFAGAPAAVDARTGTGSVRLTVPGGDSYAVAATAQTGKVEVTVPQQEGLGRTINAHAETGDVTVAHG